MAGQVHNENGSVTVQTQAERKQPQSLAVQRRWLRRLNGMHMVFATGAVALMWPYNGKAFLPFAAFMMLTVAGLALGALLSRARREDQPAPNYLRDGIYVTAASIVALVWMAVEQAGVRDRTYMKEAQQALYFQALSPQGQRAYVTMIGGPICALERKGRCAEELAPYVERAKAKMGERVSKLNDGLDREQR